jgi:hypothetical protein
MELMIDKKREILCKTPAPMKMKIFSGNSYEQTEVEVNDWLSSHQVMIRHICQSQCERNGKLLFLISVFFTHLND